MKANVVICSNWNKTLLDVSECKAGLKKFHYYQDLIIYMKFQKFECVPKSVLINFMNNELTEDWKIQALIN